MILLIISKIIFFASILGLLFVLVRKLPALSHLPEEPWAEKISPKSVFIWAKRTKNQVTSSNFFQDVIIVGLEKSLRKFKILVLKISNILDKLLRRLKKNKPM